MTNATHPDIAMMESYFEARMETKPERLVDVHALSQHLQISVSRLQEMTKRRELTHYLLPERSPGSRRAVRYRISEVEHSLRKRGQLRKSSLRATGQGGSFTSKKTDGFVYIIEAVDLGVVKIGSARDVKKRLAQLQPGCPATLRLRAISPGGEQREFELHAELHAERVRGEWFALTSPTKDVIRKITSRYGRPRENWHRFMSPEQNS